MQTNSQIRKKSWPRKNLGELINFLETQHPEGLSLKTMSDRWKVSKANISNVFRRDDMKLSRVEEIAKLYGYELNLYFPVRHLDEGYVPVPPRGKYDNAGKLQGLVKYIQDSEYTISFIAEKMGVAPSTLSYDFRKGDMMLSLLNKMLDTLGICAIWNFEKKNNSKDYE